MTDAEFDRFMAKLLRGVDRDLKNAQAQARPGLRPDATQSDFTSDVEFHRYNGEWTNE